MRTAILGRQRDFYSDTALHSFLVEFLNIGDIQLTIVSNLAPIKVRAIPGYFTGLTLPRCHSLVSTIASGLRSPVVIVLDQLCVIYNLVC